MTGLPTTESRGRPTVYITHPRTGEQIAFSELAKARSKVIAEKRQLEAMSSAMEDKFAERNRLRADWILATAPRLGDYGRLRERV